MIRREWPLEAQAVARQQALLGWQALFEGVLASDWSSLQQSHYDKSGSRRTGLKWVSQHSHKIWQAVFKMWEHQNAVLHKSGAISEFSGSRELYAVCIREFELGTVHLEEMYHHFWILEVRNSVRKQ